MKYIIEAKDTEGSCLRIGPFDDSEKATAYYRKHSKGFNVMNGETNIFGIEPPEGAMAFYDKLAAELEIVDRGPIPMTLE